MTTQLRGGATTDDPRLDRVPYWDEKNAEYPIRAILRTAEVPLAEKLWSQGVTTDQGREGACVGHGCTQEATASPDRVRIGPQWVYPHYKNDPSQFAQVVYKMAQKIDPWAGESYSGTAVLAGVQVLQTLGILQEYRWAMSMDDLRDTLLYHGPVILGVNWYESMYDTAANGLVDVSGSIVGGHCITVIGYDKSRRLLGMPKAEEMFRWKNSWGSDYGKSGTGWITAADLKRLVFDEGGEACVPVTRKMPALGQTLSL